MTRLLALLLIICPLAARAADQAPSAEPPKPSPSCPCDAAYFKPLTEKAKAAAEYWAARRHYKSARAVAGTFALFAYLAHDVRTLNEAGEALGSAESEMNAARARAEALGAVKVVDDLEGPIEFKLEEGKDYTVSPDPPKR